LNFKTHYAACYYNKKHSDIRLVLGQHLKSVKAKMSQNLSTSKTKSIYIMSKSTYIICNNVTLLNYAHIKQQWCQKRNNTYWSGTAEIFWKLPKPIDRRNCLA